MKTITTLAMFLSILGPCLSSAQIPVFDDGFETASTAAWSTTFPAPDCATIVTFEDGLTPSTELHVATSGSDQNGTGSSGNPYASIGWAAQFAGPGTAIRIHPGTYDGGIYLSDLAGSSTAPIWIGGLPGQGRPVINSGNEALHLTRVSWLVVHDLEIQNSSANGINCDDGGDYDNPLATHHVIFRDLNIHHIGSGGNEDCLKLSGLDYFWVLDSEFAYCGGGTSGSGVDHVGCHHGLLARNSFSTHSGNAIQAKGGSEDIEIRWNHMVEGGARSVNMGGSTGPQYFRPPLSTSTPNSEARNIRVVGNLIEGATASLAYVGCVDCVVAHNTLVDPHNWILRILQETTSSPPYSFLECQDGLFLNNLVYFDRSDLSTYVNVGPNTHAGTFVFAHNLWYAWNNPSQSQPSLPATETNGIYGDDPGFTTGYHIDNTSPAAGMGLPLPWLTGDRDGRCYSYPPSIGAYEVP